MDYASCSCSNTFGYAPRSVAGVSLYQLTKSNRATELMRVLAETKAGKVVYLEHVLMINAGIEIKVTSTFYPEVMMLTMDERSSYILMQPRIPNEEGMENCD